MSTRVEPYLNQNFRVEIDGIAASSFTEVSGLEAAIEVIEYREGSDPQNSVRKLPGLRKFTNITLKRGITHDTSLWNWMHSNLTGVLDRRNISIVLKDEKERDMLRWNLSNAWPCKWLGPTLNAECNDIAIETLELCYERLELVLSA